MQLLTVLIEELVSPTQTVVGLVDHERYLQSSWMHIGNWFNTFCKTCFIILILWCLLPENSIFYQQ